MYQVGLNPAWWLSRHFPEELRSVFRTKGSVVWAGFWGWRWDLERVFQPEETASAKALRPGGTSFS